MKKIIRLTESQFFKVVDEKKNLMELEDSPTYIDHWERMFEKSTKILLKLGHSTDGLSKKITEIADKDHRMGESNNLYESFKIDGHEYNLLKTHDGTIYVGSDGILGDNRVVIPWDLINKLRKKYNINIK